MAKRAAPEVNAGSMADIAFLLLIFFLVTTTMEKDSGISRKLPPIEDSDEDVIIKERNIFEVMLNGSDQLMVEKELMDIKDLRAAAIEFLDNAGGTDNDGNTCDYCKGRKDINSSDHPDKAIISLKNDRKTSYGQYISVQNELVAAYNELRNRRALTLGPQRGFADMSFKEMLKNAKDVNWPGNTKKLKELIDQIKKEYPLKLSEVKN